MGRTNPFRRFLRTAARLRRRVDDVSGHAHELRLPLEGGFAESSVRDDWIDGHVKLILHHFGMSILFYGFKTKSGSLAFWQDLRYIYVWCRPTEEDSWLNYASQLSRKLADA